MVNDQLILVYMNSSKYMSNKLFKKKKTEHDHLVQYVVQIEQCQKSLLSNQTKMIVVVLLLKRAKQSYGYFFKHLYG